MRGFLRETRKNITHIPVHSHVWKFVRGLYLPYPKLYDEGYTSLGGCSNTSPNPTLKYTDEKGIEKYKPAYDLQDGSQERAGRGKKPGKL